MPHLNRRWKPNRMRIVLVDQPGAIQSQIRIGHTVDAANYPTTP